MKAILEFQLPEDSHEFDMATQGTSMHSALWEMDQWLRAQYKYMPDEGYSEDKYNAYYDAREQLGKIMFENGIKFD